MNASRLVSRFAAFSLCVLVGCAGSPRPPAELLQARDAYAKAEKGPAARLVPAELHVAHEQLESAENAFNSHPESQDTIDIAYIAIRKAQRADALGFAASSMADKERAERDVGKTEEQLITQKDARLKDKDAELRSKDDQLDHAHDSLVKQKELTAAERAARLEAETKAHDAMEALSKSLAVKSDLRGTVITLSGGVVFATNQATILPGAQAQLDQVAAALKTQAEHHFTVEGHTDNQGTDAINDDLSQRRANAVRDYLVVHGVSANAITAQGYGSKRAVGDNANAEGRAMNRRVEIIVDKGGPVSSN